MKKVMIATVVVAFVGLAMGSCKKKYTCNCWTLTSDTTQKEGKGKTAEEACDKAANTLLFEVCEPA